MGDQASGKICVICGEDCAGQPRTKDAKGHYYHQRCHDAAKRAKAARDAGGAIPAEANAAEARAADPGGLDLGEPDPFGLLDEVIGESAAGAAVAGPGAAAAGDAGLGGAGQMCPGCATPLAAGAVICTSCGFNLQTGATLTPTLAAAPAAAGGGGGGSGEGRVWPILIGTISIFFGACGLLAHGFNAVGALGLFATAGPAFGLGALVAPLLMLLLALWLLLAGIGVVRRRQEATVQIRRWAMVKTILYATCLGCVTVGLFAGGGASDAFARGFGDGAGTDISAIGQGTLFAILLAVFGWFLFWPIFVLIWFNRATIQAQIGRW